MGVLFFEEGRAPRSSRVFYDRQHSAVSRMRPDELPIELFRAGGARLLHLTGITVALGPDYRCHGAAGLTGGKSGWLAGEF